MRFAPGGTYIAGKNFDPPESEVISSLLLWKSSSDNAKGRKLSFPEVISRDTGIRTEDLGWAMQDRDVWRGIVNSMKATTVKQ